MFRLAWAYIYILVLSKREQIKDIEAGMYRDDGAGISKLPKREI